MNTKVITTAFIGAIASFLLGWLVFGVLLMDFYQTNAIVYEGLMRKMPNLIGIFVAGLCWTFMISYIYSEWAGISTFGRGFTAALFIGFLITLNYDLYMYSMMHLYRIRLLAVDVVANTLYSGIIGGLTGWLLGRGRVKETT